MSHGDRLSGLDASFLHLERGPAHMHVASTTIFEGPAPDYEEFRDHIASRLHLVPRFRQKLRFVPFAQGRPVWVDGVSGVDIATVLFGLDREPEPVPEPEPWLPEPEPSDTQILAEALLERATDPAEMVRGARAVLRVPRQMAGAAIESLGAAGS